MLRKILLSRIGVHSGSEALRFVSKAVEVARGSSGATSRRTSYRPENPRAIIALLPRCHAPANVFLNGTSGDGRPER